MKKTLSTRGAAALLALTMGFMGQDVAQAAPRVERVFFIFYPR